MSDSVPDWAKVWLDVEVAKWLHEEADRFYDGDVSRALNTTLKAVMKAQKKPDDPWVFIEAQARTRRQ